VHLYWVFEVAWIKVLTIVLPNSLIGALYGPVSA